MISKLQNKTLANGLYNNIEFSMKNFLTWKKNHRSYLNIRPRSTQMTVRCSILVQLKKSCFVLIEYSSCNVYVLLYRRYLVMLAWVAWQTSTSHEWWHFCKISLLHHSNELSHQATVLCNEHTYVLSSVHIG